MKNLFGKILYLSIVLPIIISCGSEQILKKYYVLDYTDEIQPAAADEPASSFVPQSVRIEPFSISQTYNNSRIALRSQSNELKFFYNHFWSENPASAIRNFLFKKLDQSTIFSICYLRLTQTHPDFLISGRIVSIERVTREYDEQVHLSMTLELRSSKTDKRTAYHSFDRKTAVKKNSSMNLFSQEISNILNDEIDNFIYKIQEEFIKE